MKIEEEVSFTSNKLVEEVKKEEPVEEEVYTQEERIP